jgi:hypothetical protein
MALSEKSVELTMKAADPESTLQISRSNVSGTWMHRHDNPGDLPHVHVGRLNFGWPGCVVCVVLVTVFGLVALVVWMAGIPPEC